MFCLQGNPGRKDPAAMNARQHIKNLQKSLHELQKPFAIAVQSVRSRREKRNSGGRRKAVNNPAFANIKNPLKRFSSGKAYSSINKKKNGSSKHSREDMQHLKDTFLREKKKMRIL